MLGWTNKNVLHTIPNVHGMSAYRFPDVYHLTKSRTALLPQSTNDNLWLDSNRLRSEHWSSTFGASQWGKSPLLNFFPFWSPLLLSWRIIRCRCHHKVCLVNGQQQWASNLGRNSYVPIFSMPLWKFDLQMIKEMVDWWRNQLNPSSYIPSQRKDARWLDKENGEGQIPSIDGMPT
jgi:hypothetical protein